MINSSASLITQSVDMGERGVMVSDGGLTRGGKVRYSGWSAPGTTVQ